MEQISGKCQGESDGFTTKSHPESGRTFLGHILKMKREHLLGEGPKPTAQHRKNAWGFITQRSSREQVETDGNGRGLRKGSPVM